MTPSERRLLRHLGLVVAVKFVLLAVLWAAFVRPLRVPVDAQAAALRLASPSATAPSDAKARP